MEEGGPFAVSTGSPRKVRFAPKVPTRKARKPAEVKNEVHAEAEAAQTRELLKLVNEGSRRRGPKSERKPEPAQVAFGYSGRPSSIRTFGKNRGSSSNSSTSRLQTPLSDDGQIVPGPKRTKEYLEPWDYNHSYYPTTLPLRRPYSGNPELLDVEEFGEAAENSKFNENSKTPAVELGLMEEHDDVRMLFLQLPASFPLLKRPSSVKGKETVNSMTKVGHGLNELPAGLMGKMLVYKSGAVKMKLGNIIYDVSPGSECMFAQNVAAINVEEKHCIDLGDVDKGLVVTPDIESLLNACK
ncbi:hypothetical protein ACHQM5_011551 [Ranunculus cassubicifolius]